MATRVTAHPLIVAVAMGLLSPTTLASLPEDPPARCEGCDCPPGDDCAPHPPEPSELEMERVEREWHAVVGV